MLSYAGQRAHAARVRGLSGQKRTWRKGEGTEEVALHGGTQISDRKIS